MTGHHPISIKLLEALKKRLSYNLSPENVSSSEGLSREILSAYMAFCAIKYDVHESEEDLVTAAFYTMSIKPAKRTIEKTLAALQWMKENLATIEIKSISKAVDTKKLEISQKKYAKQVVVGMGMMYSKTSKPKIIEDKKTTSTKKVYPKRMTDEEFIIALGMRIVNGFLIVSLSDEPQWKMLNYILEAIRLKAKFANRDMRTILSAVHKADNGRKPTASTLDTYTTFYEKMVKMIGSDVEWPRPEHNRKINGIAHVLLENMPQEETEEEEETPVDLAKPKAAAPVRQSYGLAFSRRIKKNQDKETRTKAASELDRKVHDIYRTRHGHDTKHIPMDEYREISAIIHKESLAEKRAEEKAYAAELAQLRGELPFVAVHKVRLFPNNVQKTHLKKCFGVARFCYNWAYDTWKSEREKGNLLDAEQLQAKFNEIAKDQYPFTYEVTHFAKQTGFKAFDASLTALMDHRGFPNRKKHGIGFGSLTYITTGKRKTPYICDFNPDIPGSLPSKKRQYLLIPTFGYVKMAEKLRFDGLMTMVTIKLESDGNYYAAIKVYISQEEWKKKHKNVKHPSAEPLGIDLGVADLAILSNGLKIESRPEDEKLNAKKKDLQKSISRLHELHPQHTSKNQRKLQWQLANVKSKIKMQRLDYIHKVTSALAYHYNNISMEHLNVENMIQKGITSGRIIDATFYQFRKLMEQKSGLAGHALHIADRFFPSTRTCSVCGCIGDKVPLNVRTFHCKDCGATIDRDINAAINLAKLIGLDEPNFQSADKDAIAAVLQANGIIAYQEDKESR